MSEGEGEVLLKIVCATADRGAIVDALRTRARCPIHVRAEAVSGLDFSDASVGERVTGALDRLAIELVVPAGEAMSLVETAAACKLDIPVLEAVMRALGYHAHGAKPAEENAPRKFTKPRRRRRDATQPVQPGSPFAALAGIKFERR